jgi:hypothetical protein
VARRKAFPLRLDAEIYDAIRAWAADELRSANAQIEFLLARALEESGRLPRRGGARRGDGKRKP